jgi:predicted solute-binding protein
MRLWKNYINKQLYSECQLITAINAYYYLTGKIIKQESQEYEDLVDLVKARNGSALYIKRVHEKLGLITLKKAGHLWDLWDDKKLLLPIGATVWHKKTGFHSVAIVEQCLKTDCIRIANFQDATSLDGWMFREDFYQYETQISRGDDGRFNSKGKQWRYQVFGLRRTKI